MIIDDSASRRAARNRRVYRAIAVFCALGAFAAVLLALRTPAVAGRAADVRVDADTRFDFVAVFAPDADAAAVERWRADVLRVHRAPCLARLPCLARVARFAALGTPARYAIAFDLNREIGGDERAALLAAAQAQPSLVRLVAAATPRAAAGP